MKTLICLLVLAGVCNATFWSLLEGKQGGSGGFSHASRYSSHNHGQAHSNYHGHAHRSNFPNVIKIIWDQGHNGGQAGAYSYDSGHSYGLSSYGHGGEAKIVNAISHIVGPPAPVHRNQAYSAGGPSGLPYASGYSYSGADSFSSQFSAILPHILELILQDNVGYGNDINPQLVSHFGRSGKAFITRSNGKSNSYYSGGHVVQKGVLKITRIEGTPPGISSYGAPIKGHPSQSHGW